MPINPIAVVEQVIEEYRSYLLTEFRARDETLRRALEQALDRPGFLAQDPFFQAHRPFKVGRAWRELGIDARFARAIEERAGARAYLHQSEAIQHLLGPDAGPLVVTTGTGSGKTECFLVPAIQNAIEDSTTFRRPGLTAVLVYPMNALANDQEERIRSYLEASGHTHVRVERYDRSTDQAKRAEMRETPPHLLLTNYMMLEYLLVRPADRDALFANHRCRFLVLDEVHSYRGSLGANIALLVRRLRAHLGEARQDWAAEDRSNARRFPRLVPVGTSATIKSLEESGRSPDEVRQARDAAVQEFLGKLTGFPAGSFRVLGEELEEVKSGGDGLASRIGALIVRKPLSLGQIAEAIRQAPAWAGKDLEAIRREVRQALIEAAGEPDGAPGALRLRTHRFVRGGWKFHRCVDPMCGRLYPMGEERCSCGRAAAPLLLCRSCGSDVLRFGGASDPDSAPLSPYKEGAEDQEEWLLYDRVRLDLADDAEDEDDREMRGRAVVTGTFNPATCSFSKAADYSLRVKLAPARTRCLVCDGWSPVAIMTPVALGTSAAVRVLTEGLVEGLVGEHARTREGDGKERILIFADSRQDAAHQARFINYAARYDRMRRRLVAALGEAGRPLFIEEAITALFTLGTKAGDNPHVDRNARSVPEGRRKKAKAWEEAPLLDDLAVSASYRATVFNLGVVGVRYSDLDRLAEVDGKDLSRALGLDGKKLAHLSRCLLDEMRAKQALARPALQYHPMSPACPEEYRESADWERRRENARPRGYACDEGGNPVTFLDDATIPDGIAKLNNWRRPGRGGAAPRIARKYQQLMRRLGGIDADEHGLIDVLKFLKEHGFLVAAKLHGLKKTRALLQVSDEALAIELLGPEDRFRCDVCTVRLPWSWAGAPCPSCSGQMVAWLAAEVEGNRYVKRIRKADLPPLRAGEHTAQVTGEGRIELEQQFKGGPERSLLNVLACSPTLEMGIDVGGLDAVVMRNVPPRPDNYAQRGGRAGRRTRVGIVLGYARSTPHDGYFYDKPTEMIAGEVVAPAIALGNRDVVIRHLNAIAFGLAEPGLAGRMIEYMTLQGELKEEKVVELVAAVETSIDRAVRLAFAAWGPEILGPADLDTEDKLRATLADQPAKIRDVFARVRRQIIELQNTITQWADQGTAKWSAITAMDLKKRLLGMPADDRRAREEADDRGAGHPMRRFAEFGLLPGYEFPSEPATLRLQRDEHEEEPVSVERRFGLAQYRPGAIVHARGHRWKVVGLDMASPWNPRADEPQWLYVLCPGCDLRYSPQDHTACPRCGRTDAPGRPLPAFEFGGFLAQRDDTPVLAEEDRYASAGLLRSYPQWNGLVVGRQKLATDWRGELREREDVRWLNEGLPPSGAEDDRNAPRLHPTSRGFYLCQGCGRLLRHVSDVDGGKTKGRRKARTEADDPFGHAQSCARRGQPPEPMALSTRASATTFRLVVDLPFDMEEADYKRWGLSLGYALRTGMRQLYTLDGPEIEFDLEPMWEKSKDGRRWKRGSLTFIDPSVGGTGFLFRVAAELHLIATRSLEHLDHPDCQSACYRCLKSYQNQRHHEYLNWPAIVSDLDSLAGEPPAAVALSAADIDDPGPWLDAYDAGVGSPLELKFLHLFEQHGIDVEKQVPVAPDINDPPISQADFRVSGGNVLIYIDGAAFHRGNRLRRDRAIRKALREGSARWRVVELTARDLSKPDEIIKRVLDSEHPLDEVRRRTRNDKVVVVARLLLERLQTSGGGPLRLDDSLAFARQVSGDSGDALLALERLVQAGAVRRVFLDLKHEPPRAMSWDEVLVRLGGPEALASEAWREGARSMLVQWFPVNGRQP